MDVLSAIVTALRTGRPRSARVAWPAPWHQRFAPVPGAVGVQVVLRGPCWLITTGAEPTPLAAGDVLISHGGPGYALADSPTSPPTGPACGPEDITTMDPYINHGAGSGGESAVTLCGAYELDPARTHPLLAELPALAHLPAHLGRHADLRAVVDLLGAELQRPRLGGDAALPALLDVMLLYALRAWFDEQPPAGTTGWIAALHDPATLAALHAMHRDPAHPWTVAALAAEGGLSRAPFARRFTALIGQPPLSYLTWWRMSTAARLLRESGAPLHAIAAKVGYTSEFAFATAFKREFGAAPGRYRTRA
ncbi:putative AraC-family transcriptional regulator [Actinoplanes missouriensis 431]|uniref:Putative AraC-family transcriptional regulator n=1 Tax=Actinoplanes missouriensis (strain ATCC 14538 / DSM 43046 / CBS 188.64 / JCM 3121 / NBRC 102363 / NCIMB 12654 / NRRL B-3342 / UNCC 431) TaxID=512565 RepID=I0H8P8_ACTM4|nr:AraC family transcriptional regulator [Actinoplanes missouriensis]BAL89385.1 putative AraC-family transcriptional regulator [Actinoplanes missouriensis 431]